MQNKENNTPSKEDLELINLYSRNPLEESEVYCFNLTLCDNEIDRDFERFSIETLTALKDFFVGKTGISDHNLSSENQKARIFKTWLETDDNKKTAAGESYTKLCARAYTLKTADNESFIKEIEGGIKKEVSIGCAVKDTLCSLCGKSLKAHACSHVKGKVYKGKLCHGILSGATDAYEWSFVAVPAQKNAGVTKSYTEQENNLTEKVFSENEELKKKLSILKEQVKALETQAADGVIFKKRLIEKVKKYALLSLPQVNLDGFIKGCEAMETKELMALSESLKSQANKLLPLCPQLKAVTETKEKPNNNVFKI
ncbi:MAG: hypothetical protein ACI4GC_05465 [Acutalibacteraceae bacterium]